MGIQGSAGTDISIFRIRTHPQTHTLSFRLLKSVSLPKEGIQSVRIRHASPSLLLAGGWDGAVRVFGAHTLRPLALLRFHTKGVQCVDVGEGGSVYVCSGDGSISVWALYQGERGGRGEDGRVERRKLEILMDEEDS